MTTRRMAGVGCATVLAGLLASAPAEAQKGKPSPQANWECTISLADTFTSSDSTPYQTVIRSDGKGPYTHGTTNKVTCEIYSESGNPKFKLHFQPTFKSTRRVVILAQEGYTGAQTLQPDYFEVLSLKTAVPVQGEDAVYMRPFRMSKDGASRFFRGNSFIGVPEGDPWYADTGNLYTGSSSVFVRPFSNCAWEIWFDPSAPGKTVDANGKVVENSEDGFDSMILPAGTIQGNTTFPRTLGHYENTSKTGSSQLGFFPMPFHATVSINGTGATCTP
jgi:hypothetical protein